uniref:Uncharacterized protein n=1 Tax=Rhizophora mucronata TaxID=61149 RepID=A0A2P2JD39_RHIMU
MGLQNLIIMLFEEPSARSDAGLLDSLEALFCNQDRCSILHRFCASIQQLNCARNIPL